MTIFPCVPAPSSPPDNLTLSNSTYDSATFEWSLPLGLSQLLSIWYIVEVQENGNITTTTETSCPSLTLTLNPNTQYCLRVLGAVSGGYSPWSTQLCIDAPGTRASTVNTYTQSNITCRIFYAYSLFHFTHLKCSLLQTLR